MVRVPALAVVLALVGCDGGSSAPLDVDVLIRETGSGRHATVFIREPYRDCGCSAEFAVDGECAHGSDDIGCSCSPPPGACLGELRVEIDGEVYARDRADETYVGVLGIEMPATGDGLNLVVTGCGGVQSAPLPAAPPADSPRLTEIASDEEDIILHWEGADAADRIMWTAFYGIGSQACDTSHSGELRFPRYLAESSVLGVDALDSTHDGWGPLGKIRVWNVASATTLRPVQHLSPGADDTWRVPGGGGATIALMIDDRIDGGALQADVTVRLDGPLDESIVINGDSWDIEGMGQFWFRAGPASDSLEVEWGSRTYAGSFPHQVPVDPLELGRPEVEVYEVHLGPVTLTDVADATRSITTSMEVRWKVGVVARPVP